VNCKQLTQRIKEVEVLFLNIKKIDIRLVSGNCFMEQNYVKIPTYTTYVTNHLDSRAHAGSAKRKKKSCFVMFLDFTQAFDKVWHPGQTPSPCILQNLTTICNRKTL
jgi:hypothetical protein